MGLSTHKMKLYRRPNRKSYYTRYRENGRIVQLCLHTESKREAEHRLAGLAYSRLPSSIRTVATRPETMLSDVWRMYLRTDSGKVLKKSSLEEKFAKWDTFTKWVKVKTVEQITPDVAARYLASVAERTSPQNANYTKGALSSIWRSVFPAMTNPWTATPPMPVIGADKYRSFTDDEMSRILAALSGDMRRLTEVGLYTGLRLKDAVHLHSAQIVDGRIELIPAKTHRSGRIIRIPIHPKLKWLHAVTGQIFPDLAAEYDREDTKLSRIFCTVLKKLGITGGKVGFHSLRVTFVTRCEQAGINRALVQGMVGHSTAGQTAHYSEATATDEQISKL